MRPRFRRPAIRRLGLGVAVATLVLARLAAAAPPPSEARLRELVRTFRGSLLEELSARHLGQAVVDADRIVRAAAARLRVGETPESVATWRDGELVAAILAFAQPLATPDPTVRYRLPFELSTPRLCVQGVGGELTHGEQAHYHAFDFSMPIGTAVLAARPGVVGRVIDGFLDGGTDPARRRYANAVYVLHEDGSFAAYAHLSRGIVVREGERVALGQKLGLSGNTGYSRGPHLHFEVSRLVTPQTSETVPILFGVGSPEGFVPEAGRFYGNPATRLEACADLASAPPPGATASEALRGFFATFHDLNCGVRLGAGVDYFTKAEEPAPGRLRLTASSTWVSLMQSDRELQLAMLHEAWTKASRGKPVRVEIVDPRGRLLMERASAKR